MIFRDAPPERPRTAASVSTGHVARRGNHQLLPSPAPVKPVPRQPLLYELPDGEVIAIGKRQFSVPEAERTRERERLQLAAAARQLRESEAATAALERAARDEKRRRRLREESTEPYTTRPSPAEEHDATLRFRVGERVEANCGTIAPSSRGSLRWQAGKVVEVNHRAPHYPAGHTMPYLLRLDVGGLLVIPIDDERVVRRATDARPPGGASTDASDDHGSKPSGASSVGRFLKTLGDGASTEGRKTSAGQPQGPIAQRRMPGAGLRAAS